MTFGRFKVGVAARILFSAIILVTLIAFAPVKEIGREVVNISLPWFLSALALTALGTVVSALRLQLFASMFAPSIRFRESLRSYVIGYFFNAFLPTSIGGDVAKVYDLRSKFEHGGDVVVSVFLDRLSGLLAVVLIFAALLVLFPAVYPTVFGQQVANTLLLLLATIVVGGLILIPVWGKYARPFVLRRQHISFFREIERVTAVIREGRYQTKTILITTLLSLVFHSIRALIIMVLVLSVGGNVAFLLVASLLPLLTIVNAIPISIGGLGTNEATLIFGLTHMGVMTPEAFSVALIMRVSLYLNAVLGGIWYALRKS